jgi:hypothetical protein
MALEIQASGPIPVVSELVSRGASSLAARLAEMTII